MFSGGLRTKAITKQSQENMPLITVVTVVRNGEETLEETILSVIDQTYENVEYIIIDGASIDGTIDIIKKYEEKIDYWMSEPDKGIYDAMNKGIDLATGEWINFMNSGDRFYAITTLQHIFEKENAILEADIFYGNALIVYDLGSFVQKPKSLNNILSYLPFVHQASFIKSGLMKKVKYNETYKSSGDYEFFYNSYINKCFFAYIDIVIAVYNAEYGISHNYKIVKLEDARIHGIKKNIRWKIIFSVNYTVYLFKILLKKLLPKSFVRNIKRKNIEKLLQKKDLQ